MKKSFRKICATNCCSAAMVMSKTSIAPRGALQQRFSLKARITRCLRDLLLEQHCLWAWDTINVATIEERDSRTIQLAGQAFEVVPKVDRVGPRIFVRG